MKQMTFSALGHMIPIAVSLILAATVGIYTWRRRNIAGARSFVVLLMLEGMWVACVLGEKLAPTLPGKIFFDNIRWVASLLSPLALVSFAFEYTSAPIHRAVRFWTLLMVIPTITLALIFTNGAHGLAMHNQRLVSGQPFSAYLYDFGWPLLICVTVNYLMIFMALLLLGSFALRQSYLYRTQMLTIATGLLIPVLGSVLSMLNLVPGMQRDIYPYTSAIGNLFIAVGLFSFRVFDIVPIAREHVFDNMEDGVIVVDSRGRLVDINQAARRFLGEPGLRATGQPLSQLPRSWASQIDLATDPEQHHELLVSEGDDERYYDLRVKTIQNTKSRPAGHLIMLRDISLRKRAENRLHAAYAELEWRVRERTEELSRSVARLENEICERQRVEAELRESYDATLEGWSRALEMRERETAGHSKRVVNLTLLLAQKLGVSEDDIVNVRRGAILHDIGKMGVPDSILLKPGPLTLEEWEIMREHPRLAFDALSRVAFLRPALDIPYCHHEHWDGSGYPRGLRGEEIPLAARLFAVVDVWDALNSERPYRRAWSEQAVLAYIGQQAGRQFDPRVVSAFFEVLEGCRR